MRSSRAAALGVGVVIVITAPGAASAGDPPADLEPAVTTRPANLGLFAAAGGIASPGAAGGAFLAGLRLGVGDHFAASMDLGYGLLGAADSMQDRWWLMPSAALVVPAGHVRFEIGAGGGVGTSSGYTSWASYAAQPFTPTWHFTVPAARVHAAVAFELARDLDLFARADAASLITVGSAESPAETTWFALWIGVEPRLL